MMMKLKRLLAALLALLMILMLGACGTDKDDAKETQSDKPSASQSQSPAPSASGTDESETERDPEAEAKKIAFYEEKLAGYTQQIAGLDPDEVVMTINGEEITAEYYLYWLTYDCMYWDSFSQYIYNTPLDMDGETSEGVTNAEYLKGDARDFATYYILLEQNAAKENAALTQEQVEAWEKSRADYVLQNGEAENAYLAAQAGLNEEEFAAVNTYGELYANLADKLYGNPPQEELDAYIEVRDLLRAKHILIGTAKEDDNGKVVLVGDGSEVKNEDGTPFTGTALEYNKKVQDKVKDILDQLEKAEDPLSLFDKLMWDYSEDPGLTGSPDGYDFTAGEMVEEFEQATRDLEYGEISGAVASPYGYHIILRLRPDALEKYKEETLTIKLDMWMSEAVVETNELFDGIDVKTVYENYKAYQEELLAVRNG